VDEFDVQVSQRRKVSSTDAIDWISTTENPKSIRTRATPIDRRNPRGESPSSRAVLGETSATTDSLADAAAETIAVAAARAPAGESSGMCNEVNASVVPASAAAAKVGPASGACAWYALAPNRVSA
jgi:hypothetical protein